MSGLRARGAPHDGEAPPAAILWTDPKRDWAPLLAMLRERLPELRVLGEYDPEARVGPAIWLRCEVDGAPGPEPEFPPILYLPGVSQEELRAGEDGPDSLKPLVELLHRGVSWRHPNARDWTAAGFLGSAKGKGVGLDLADDARTTESLRKALPEMARIPLARFEGRRLEAHDFDRLLVGDLSRDLLRWLGNPDATRADLAANAWDAFRSRCRDELGFDPAKTGADVEAGARLGSAKVPWNTVWDRFCEAPGAFPGIEDLLRRSHPGGSRLMSNPARWPKENDRREEALRGDLAEAIRLDHRQACERVEGLERLNGERRRTVWARLGRAPLAGALEHLARLGEAAKSAIGGTSLNEIEAAYLERGWRADAAAWEAIAEVRDADRPLVASVVRHLLEPWLDASAHAFQDVLKREPRPGGGSAPVVEVDASECLFFVDGLRYDLGRRLAERLEAKQGFVVEVKTRWAALPTVTATAKPAVTPVARDIEGAVLGASFAPRFAGSGKPVEARSLRAAMEERGYQILNVGEPEAPASADRRGWLETGDIDKTGHHEQDDLPRRLPQELDRLEERIAALLALGWRAVRIVTDHGWLYLPGGLPRMDLPKHLTETRWARCAVIAGASSADVPRFPWRWNDAEDFAAARGITCFNKSDAFAHGGLSIQEC